MTNPGGDELVTKRTWMLDAGNAPREVSGIGLPGVPSGDPAR
jgi:hypothetical protein